MSLMFKKQHPRDEKVRRAKEEANRAIADIFKRYELSYGEVFHILSEYIHICAEVMIDKERSGEETKKMCQVCGEPRESCSCTQEKS